MSEEEPTFENELGNLIDAFFALMPTANRISQFVMLAEGQDFETMGEAYPELLKDRNTREKFFKLFGYEIREGKIVKTYSDFRSPLDNSISSYLRIFSKEEWNNRITAALLKETPNPELDWLTFRLQALKEADATAVSILKIWKTVGKERRNYVLEPKEILEALKEHMELTDEQLKDALDLIMQYKLIKEYGDKYTFSDELTKYENALDEIGVE